RLWRGAGRERIDRCLEHERAAERCTRGGIGEGEGRCVDLAQRSWIARDGHCADLVLLRGHSTDVAGSVSGEVLQRGAAGDVDGEWRRAVEASRRRRGAVGGVEDGRRYRRITGGGG